MSKKLISISILCNNEKIDRHTDIMNYITMLVRSMECQSLKSGMKTALESITTAHPEYTDRIPVSSNTDDLAIIQQVLGVSADTFTESLKLYEVAQSEILSTGVTKEDFASLKKADRMFLTLIAHMNCRAVNFSYEEISKDEIIKFKDNIINFRKDCKISDLKSRLQAMFNSLVSEEGDMFYGLKVRKSNLATDTIVQAVGLTSGKAKLNKDKDDYSFSNKFSKLNLLQILSDYFGVVCYGKSNEVEVIKPQSQEAPVETQPVQSETVEKSTEKPAKKSTRKSAKKGEKVA